MVEVRRNLPDYLYERSECSVAQHNLMNAQATARRVTVLNVFLASKREPQHIVLAMGFEAFLSGVWLYVVCYNARSYLS
jgi:hypothetical protein